MSIVVSGSDCSSLNLASAYLDYLRVKSAGLTTHYATQYEESKENLNSKFSAETANLEKNLRQDLEAYEQKLSEINRTQVSELVNYLDDKLLSLVDKILLKLGVYNISSVQISDLIRIELADLLKSRTVNVRANADTINYLKFGVEINGFIDAYEEDDTIKDGSCIISDGMCVCSADISTAVAKIKELFKKE